VSPVVEALVEVRGPEVVFRADRGAGRPARPPVAGATAVAREILARRAPFAPLARPAIVKGAVGLVVPSRGRLLAAIAFTVAGGRIVEIDLVADPEKLRARAF
jgi:RNA polymerase sigma-70 factor (ECF subfamily)